MSLSPTILARVLLLELAPVSHLINYPLLYVAVIDLCLEGLVEGEEYAGFGNCRSEEWVHRGVKKSLRKVARAVNADGV